MKNERGSSLLIVMLIVFVTATIGTAVSSFILYNYRLRTLDNEIGRAEYEAEKIMDEAYKDTQNKVKEYIAYCVKEDAETVSGRVNFNDSIQDVNNALESTFKQKFEEYFEYNYYTDIGISDNYDDTLAKQLIKTNSSVVNNKIIVSLTACYSKDDAPLVSISADFVISIPSYEDAASRKYDLNQIVGITNWKMYDWGYL